MPALERKGHSELSWAATYVLLSSASLWFWIIYYQLHGFFKLSYRCASCLEYKNVAWNYDKDGYQSSSLRAAECDARIMVVCGTRAGFPSMGVSQHSTSLHLATLGCLEPLCLTQLSTAVMFFHPQVLSWMCRGTLLLEKYCKIWLQSPVLWELIWQRQK